MKSTNAAKSLLSTIEPLVTPLGYRVVDLAAERVKGRTQVRCVLYRAGGVSVDDLVDVHHAIAPTIRQHVSDRDASIEFSSPGVERSFKSFREFGVFQGHQVAVLQQGRDDWVSGRILEATEAEATVATDDGTQQIKVTPESVAKARLVDER